MNYGPLVIIGAFVTAACSFVGLVATPQKTIGQQDIVEAKWSATRYPVLPSGDSRNGAHVYRANGCAYCHTQQVRGMDSDLARWGIRRTVAQDYLYENPVLLGTLRVGPDLTDIGTRNPSREWHLLHLYNPRIVVPGSIMPPYPYLFRKQKTGSTPSPNALALAGDFQPEDGYEVIPRPEAEALVAYMISRRINTGLEEAPLPPEEKPEPPAAPAGTDTPAAVESYE